MYRSFKTRSWSEGTGDAVFHALLLTAVAAYATFSGFDRWDILSHPARIVGPAVTLLLWLLAAQCWRDAWRRRGDRRENG